MADNYLERQREDYEERKKAFLDKNKGLKTKKKSSNLTEEMRSIREEQGREHL